MHIEVSNSLETDAFISCLMRFISRRGRPHTILSDNGTNFVGAVRELKCLVQAWDTTKIADTLAQDSIRWKFNPPSAPHFGGSWERLVRSCKKAMVSVLGGRRLTDEVLTTTMCLVESTLNGRPLTTVSSDVSDLEALTPNHFLLGRRNGCTPIQDVTPREVCHRKQYRQAEAYADLVWQRWQREYIPEHTKRSKWRNDELPILDVGDLVWILEPTQPRARFPLARVKRVNYGDDGIPRSAVVRTQVGEYTRPLVKLVPVEVNSTCVLESAPEQGRLC